jgi:hypothetical protein
LERSSHYLDRWEVDVARVLNRRGTLSAEQFRQVREGLERMMERA